MIVLILVRNGPLWRNVVVENIRHLKAHTFFVQQGCFLSLFSWSFDSDTGMITTSKEDVDINLFKKLHNIINITCIGNESVFLFHGSGFHDSFYLFVDNLFSPSFLQWNKRTEKSSNRKWSLWSDDQGKLSIKLMTIAPLCSLFRILWSSC